MTRRLKFILMYALDGPDIDVRETIAITLKHT